LTGSALVRGLVVVLLVLAAAPGSASAEFGIAPGSFTVSMTDAEGNPDIRAGGHPDRLAMEFELNTTPSGRPDGNLKDLAFELPRGVAGNPRATPTCSREQFGTLQTDRCLPEAQVGVASVGSGVDDYVFSAPIYNLASTSSDYAAEFGTKLSLIGQHFLLRMLPDGQTFAMEVGNLVQDAPTVLVKVELWGIPADHQAGTTLARRPFLTAPTGCDEPPPTATVRVESWQQPGVWRSATTQAGPTPVGCENLAFDPQLDLALDSAATDSPTGAQIGVTVPQQDDPDGVASARIREATVLLPDGMALSPSAANGLLACTDAALGAGTDAAPRCPPASRIGTITVNTPILDAPISGVVYLGEQQPSDRYRLFLVARGPGVDLRLKGSLRADPSTGRLTTVLTGLPEVPFERLTLNFDGGPGAALVTPLACGPSTATVVLRPYGGGPAVTASDTVAISSDPFGVACGANAPFAPSFVAGSSPARAGIASPFATTLRRRDGEQLLDRFSITMPPGLTARLASVERCSSAQAATGACPADSRIGSVATEAGSGPSPFPLHGDAYLTGPYRRAPFGFALVVRAIAGPFDLGTIVIRAALRVDPRTGQVKVDSDPLPRVVDGIPLRMQTLALDIDRPGFLVNPTGCKPSKVGAVVASTQGAVSRSSARYAVGHCRALRFRPAMSLALTDRSQLRNDGHPGLRLAMRMVRGGSNMRAADMRLPKPLEFSPGAVTAICSREQAKDRRCPKGSLAGRARARSPMVSGPLTGTVHVTQPRGNGLPDLLVSLSGEGVDIDITMRNSVKKGRLRSEFAELPDLPLSSLALRFASGKRGIFSVRSSLCRDRRPRRLVATTELTAHNEAYRRLRTRVGSRPQCGKPAAGSRRSASKRRSVDG
jgi:hypothetical protein